MLVSQSAMDTTFLFVYWCIAVAGGFNIENLPFAACTASAFFHTMMMFSACIMLTMIAHVRWKLVLAASKLQAPKISLWRYSLAVWVIGALLTTLMLSIIPVANLQYGTFCFVRNPQFGLMLVFVVKFFCCIYAVLRYKGVMKLLKQSAADEEGGFDKDGMLAQVNRLLRNLMILYGFAELTPYLTVGIQQVVWKLAPSTHQGVTDNTPRVLATSLLIYSNQVVNPILCVTYIDRYRAVVKYYLHKFGCIKRINKPVSDTTIASESGA